MNSNKISDQQTSQPRRKIIFVWTYLEWGGAQIYFLAIMKEARSDWDVIVVLPRDSSPEIIRFIEQTGAKCEFLDFHLDNAPAKSVLRALQRQLRRIRAEIACFRHLLRHDLSKNILHIEAAPWQSWILLTALSLRRANIFVTLHNALPKSPSWREFIWKLRMQFVSRVPRFHIFTSNKDTREKFRGWVTEKFWQNIKVTYTSVNPTEIEKITTTSPSADEIRKRHGIDKHEFVVLCVGQFVDRKGRWIFLDAAKIVAKEHSDVIFVWLSPTMPTGYELARINEYGLDDDFKFVLSETVGSEHEDVLRFFRIANVFALPSFVEGLPIALLEAMALGVPSISTNVYAIPEAVKHMETGILIEAGEASALAVSVLQVKNDAGLRTRLSEKGSEYVLQNFDERIASRIALAAYEECF